MAIVPTSFTGNPASSTETPVAHPSWYTIGHRETSFIPQTADKLPASWSAGKMTWERSAANQMVARGFESSVAPQRININESTPSGTITPGTLSEIPMMEVGQTIEIQLDEPNVQHGSLRITRTAAGISVSPVDAIVHSHQVATGRAVELGHKNTRVGFAELPARNDVTQLNLDDAGLPVRAITMLFTPNNSLLLVNHSPTRPALAKFIPK